MAETMKLLERALQIKTAASWSRDLGLGISDIRPVQKERTFITSYSGRDGGIYGT